MDNHIINPIQLSVLSATIDLIDEEKKLIEDQISVLRIAQTKFTDHEFPPNTKSLTYMNDPHSNLIWLRPSEIPSKMPWSIFRKGSVSGDDVQQGISWLDVMAIDINPLDQYVLKQDFFELEEPQGSFDVIILSLVLNFVGDIRKRGLMLKKCQILLREKDHSNPQDLGGLLFLVLPLACTANSRYLTQELLLEILEALGFKLLEHKDSPKLTFFVLQLVKKKVYRYGKRNNFCILLSKDD